MYVSFKKLEVSDSKIVSDLVLHSPHSYRAYFHPFDFDYRSIYTILRQAKKDIFFGLEINLDHSIEMGGFYMLRGLDEGYCDPMYGVFVSHRYSSKSLARLSLAHAECFCKLNQYRQLLLKVNPDNVRAKRLYESLGFRFLREDDLNKNLVLYKQLDRSTKADKENE